MAYLFRIKIYQIILFFFLVLGSSIIIGQAYSPLAISNQSGESGLVTTGYTISVDYTFKGNDPSRVEKVQLIVSVNGKSETANQVSISINEGDSWVPCSFLFDQSWSCSFPSGSEPLISVINNVRVVVK